MPGPPLWVVERPGSRVHLFGETVGLRAGDEWLTDELRAAVASSRVLWREADRDELSASPLLATYALAGEPLSARLPAGDHARLAAAAWGVGVDPATLEGLNPWVAGQVLESAFRAGAGVDGAHGVDVAIAGLARSSGIPIHSELGDARAVFEWFAGLGPEVELDYLRSTLDRVAEGPAELDRQVAAWLTGDLSVTEAQNRALQQGYPRLHQRLLVERNQAWVPRIESLLADDGTAFVLVGGAHLAGESNIVDLLARAGLPARRTDPRP